MGMEDIHQEEYGKLTDKQEQAIEEYRKWASGTLLKLGREDIAPSMPEWNSKGMYQ